MDAATALKIGGKAMKVAEKVIKYVKTDNEATFGLDEEVSVVLFGEDIALIRGGGCVEEITTADGSLMITPIENTYYPDWAVRVTAHPFPASSHLWNGPDLLKNNKYRSMLASLFHDLVWEHRTEIAKAWHTSEKAVSAGATGSCTPFGCTPVPILSSGVSRRASPGRCASFQRAGTMT